MEAGAFFGYICPKCKSKADIIAVAGATEPKCSCGTTMVPDPEGKSSTANAYCPKCKTLSGLVNSDRCPQCGGPFEGALQQMKYEFAVLIKGFYFDGKCGVVWPEFVLRESEN